MDSVIRDMPDNKSSPTFRQGGLWVVIMLLLVVICLFLGFLFYERLGGRAWVIFGGMAAVTALLIFFNSRTQREFTSQPVSIPVTSALERKFARSPYPGIIVEGQRVIRANDSYLDFVKEQGFVDSIDPPLPERLLEDVPDMARTAIYRLAHLSEEEAFGEEVIEYWDTDNNFRKYLLRVTLYGEQKIWEIIDYRDDLQADGGLLAQVPIGLCVISENGEILSSNRIIKNWLGVSNLDGMSFTDIVENPGGLLETPKEENRTVRFDTRLITQKGVATPIVLIANWIRQPSGKFVASMALHGHSSVAVAGPEEASNIEQSFGSVVPIEKSVLDIPFAVLDLDGPLLKSAKVLRANAAFLKLSGREKPEGLALSEILSANPSGINVFDIDANEFSSDKAVDAAVKGRDGVFVSVFSKPDGKSGRCRLFLVDISARKVLEDQLVQSQKMQAIGRLVAEIAHDFNNLLAAIRLYTDTLLGRHPIGDPSYPELQQINANVNRAAALVKKLLGYSRKQTIRAENLEVSETLSDMAVTLKQVLGEKAKLDIKHGRNLPPIRVDKSQFDTILMNLAVNARDAMKELGGGNITIESQVLEKVSLGNPALKAALDKIKGEKVVMISVSDTGTGMTDEVKEKIFEPFFTTKEQGEGTGLGLATVYGIVQQSGGHLAVESQIDVGTTFAIYLPEADNSAVEADVSLAKKIAKPVVKTPSDLAGSGQILFVEDEDSVRIIAAKTLRKRGYTVTEAADGEEAFEIIESAKAPFDLMISDVVMPGMDGPTLLKQARELLKDTRIVFISGYAEEEFSELLAEEPDVTFLPKPFTLVQLAEKVKQQIGEVA